jgi:DNA-binding XRE family transcriptional regulator
MQVDTAIDMAYTVSVATKKPPPKKIKAATTAAVLDPASDDFDLTEARKALEKTREQLAVDLGVSLFTIGRWERKEFPINKSAIIILERLLKE